MPYQLLADVVLVVHFAVVVFVAGGLVLIIFYEAPVWLFALVYTIFGLLVLAAWWFFPPTRSKSNRNGA